VANSFHRCHALSGDAAGIAVLDLTALTRSEASFGVDVGRPAQMASAGGVVGNAVASRGESRRWVEGIVKLNGHDRAVAIRASRHLMLPPVIPGAWMEGDHFTRLIVRITSDRPRDNIGKLATRPYSRRRGSLEKRIAPWGENWAEPKFSEPSGPVRARIEGHFPH
jgi:hypothetical protein